MNAPRSNGPAAVALLCLGATVWGTTLGGCRAVANFRNSEGSASVARELGIADLHASDGGAPIERDSAIGDARDGQGEDLPTLTGWGLALTPRQDSPSGWFHAVAVDGAENIYLAGQLEGTAKLGEVTLTSAGSTDIVVAKLHITGKLVWIRAFGGAGADAAHAIALNGNQVFVVGTLSKTVGFDGIELTSAGAKDAFAAALSADTGALDGRALRWGGRADDAANAIAIGQSGIWIAGQQGNDAPAPTRACPSTAARNNAFVAHLPLDKNSDAAAEIRCIGSSGEDAAYGVAVVSPDATATEERVVIVGEYGGALDLNNDRTVDLAAAGGADGFIAAFRPNGELLWSHAAASPGEERLTAVAVGERWIHATGVFGGIVRLGRHTFTPEPDTKNNILAAFISRDGTPQGGASGALSPDQICSLAVAPDGTRSLLWSYLATPGSCLPHRFAEPLPFGGYDHVTPPPAGNPAGEATFVPYAANVQIHGMARSAHAVVVVGAYAPMTGIKTALCPDGIALPAPQGVQGFVCRLSR